jgi:hypothetical protein
MSYSRLALRALLFAAAIFAFGGQARAQATRTWVSGVGDDVNPCSRTSPCKTFAGAFSKTARGGEIDALDGGGFGTVTINKSMTIDGSGAMASILGSSSNGIIINITDSGDTAKSVRIRGLAINGASSGVQGIKIISAGNVSVENCVIDGFTDGISVAGGVQVFVRNTSIRNNSGTGINVGAGSQLAMSEVNVFFNGTGLSSGGGSIISFKNNVIYSNKRDGEPTSTVALR